MAFSVLVEMLNIRLRRVAQPVKLHQPLDYQDLSMTRSTSQGVEGSGLRWPSRNSTAASFGLSDEVTRAAARRHDARSPTSPANHATPSSPRPASYRFLFSLPTLAHSGERLRLNAPAAPTPRARMARVEARAGSLRIAGREGLTEIRASGTARASSRGLLEQIRLTVERRGMWRTLLSKAPSFVGPGLTTTMSMPHSTWWSRCRKASPSTWRTGAVSSRSVALDRSISSTTPVMPRSRTGWPSSCPDGSGELRIRDVRGDVTLEDGSGGIHLRMIRGSVTVDRDGSGEFEAEGVTGSIRIDSKGSGSVDVAHVGGDFVVSRKGTGSIEHSDVKGRVEIPDRERRGRRRW